MSMNQQAETLIERMCFEPPLFLRFAGAASAMLTVSKTDCALADDAISAGWRMFEVKTRVEVDKSSSQTRVWLPAALIGETPFQTTLSNKFSAEGGTAGIFERRADALGIITAEFPARVKPVLTVTSRVATKNYAADRRRRESNGHRNHQGCGD